MSNLVPLAGALPAALRPQGKSELAAGVQAGFGVLTIRGKVFRIKFRGDEITLMRADGTGPMQAIEVVLVKSSQTIAKIFYPGGYKEGSSDAPDCWSVDGLKPDGGAPKKQNETCAACQWNIWGSRMTEDGKKGKMCADSKRLVVVPAADLKNEMFGGPMLLRVPAGSLSDMANYGSELERQGVPYFGVVTQISFGIEEAYPKLVFKALRYLTEAEAVTLLEQQAHPNTQRILSEANDFVRAEPGVAGAPGVPGPATTTGTVQAQPAAKVHVQPTVVVQPAVAQPAAAAVPPNPFAAGAGGAPVAHTTVAAVQPQPAQPAVAQPTVLAGGAFGGAAVAPPPAAQPAVQAGDDPGPIPTFLQRQPEQQAMKTIEGTATFAPTVQAQPAPATVSVAPVEETMEQKVARLTAELAAAQKPKKTRVRNPAPVDANTIAAAPAPQAQPVVAAQPQGDAVVAQPGAGAASLAALDAAIAEIV